MDPVEQNTDAAPASDAPVTDNTPATSPADDRAKMVADIMAFDPFGPAEPAKAGQSDDTGKSEDGGEGSGEPVVTEPTQAQPDPKAAAAPTQPPTQQGPTQREQELLAQVTALKQVIESTKPQAQPQAQKPDQPTAKYNLGLPPQLIQGLRSENDEEFAVAMHAVINGIANKVWGDVQDHLTKVVAPQFDQRIKAVTDNSSQSQRVHQEFYGEYPHLNNPHLMPLVQQAALSVAQQWNQQGKPISWNKDFMTAIAEFIHQYIPNPKAQVQQQPAAQPKRQQFTAQPGSRPGGAKGNEFAEVLM